MYHIGIYIPPISNDTLTGPFVPRQDNYTCFNFTPSRASINYGRINEEWCNVIINDNGTKIGPWARAGLYYYCGDRRLFTRVPPNTKGLCAMVRLGAPLTMMTRKMMCDLFQRSREGLRDINLLKIMLC